MQYFRDLVEKHGGRGKSTSPRSDLARKPRRGSRRRSRAGTAGDLPEREEMAGTTAARGCAGSGAARVPPEIDDGGAGLRRLGWSEPRRRRMAAEMERRWRGAARGGARAAGEAGRGRRRRAAGAGGRARRASAAWRRTGDTWRGVSGRGRRRSLSGARSERG